MRHRQLSPDQKRAVSMATANDGKLIRYPNGLWAKSTYKWRGRLHHRAIAGATIYSLARAGLMHLEGYVGDRPTIAALVDRRSE